MKRNGIISFWKFAFALMIVIFHGKYFALNGENVLFNGGYIGVEFFFIVSGVLLAKSIVDVWDNDNKTLGIDTWNFILKKIKTFLPYIVISFLFLVPFYYFYNNYSLDKILSSIWELLFLGESGIKFAYINIPIWYLSSMLLCMFVIYPLMRKFKKNYLYFVVPVVVILGIGFLNQQSDTINKVRYWVGFSYFTNIRAFVELNLGILIYFISKKIKDINFTTLGKVILTIVEISCFILPFLIANFINNSYRYDYILIPIIALAICIAFSQKTFDYKLLSNNLVFFFERLSLPLYVLQEVANKITVLLTKDKGFLYPTKITMYVGIALLLALITLKLIEYLKKKNYFINKFKYIFIQE